MFRRSYVYTELFCAGSMSPKSNFLWHLDNEEKSKHRLQQAIYEYADLLQDVDELHEVGGREFRGGHLWQDELDAIHEEMKTHKCLWGHDIEGEAHAVYNNRLNEQKQNACRSMETNIVHLQAQHVARHGETPEQYKNQQKRSSSEPRIAYGKSGSSHNLF